MLNEDMLISVRCNSCRHFSNKRCKCWRGKINKELWNTKNNSSRASYKNKTKF